MPKKDDISIDPKNKGKFTKWVKKNMPGKSTCAGADAVMKNKKKYKPAVVKMANYAKNFGCSIKGKGKGATAMKDGPQAGLFGGLVAEGKKKGMSDKEAVAYAGKNIKSRASEKK
jgi:hypothetical protein